MKKALLFTLAFIFAMSTTFAQQTLNEINGWGDQQSQNLTTGDIVKHLNDGKGTGTVGITYGPESVFISASAERISATALDASRFFVAFNDGATGLGKACVGTVTGNSISFGTVYEISAAFQDSKCVAMDANNVVLIYRQTPDNAGYAMAITVTDEVLSTIGTPEIFDVSAWDLGLAAMDATTFVMSWYDGTIYHGRARVGSIAGTSITFGTETIFKSAQVGNTSVSALDASTCVITFADASNERAGTAVVGSVSNTNISFGSETVFHNGKTAYSSATSMDASTFVVAFADYSNSGHGTAVVGSVSGSTITFGSQYVYIYTDTQYNSIVGLDASNFVIAFNSRLPGEAGCSVAGSVSGSAISFGPPTVFNLGRSIYTSSAMLLNDKFVVSYQDEQNSNFGTSIVGNVAAETDIPALAYTTEVTSISTNAASSGGYVVWEGSTSVTARGVCWSISPEPTIAIPAFTTSDGIGLEEFSSSITGLDDSTTYYVRAYASNSSGTGYGPELVFKTQPPPTVWIGPTIEITKADFSDPLLEENQDRMTDNVWLARGDKAGFFNARFELAFNNIYWDSPIHTEWAIGSIDDWETLEYDIWYDWLWTDPLEGATSAVGVDVVMHIIPDNIYLSIKVTSWSSGGGSGSGGGGGFTYIRSTPAQFGVSITDPINNQVLTKAAYTISGTITSGQADSVKVQLNDGSWNTPVGIENWEIESTFIPGKNTIQAVAWFNNGSTTDTAVTIVNLNQQQIPLYEGWQMISSYFDPETPGNAVDTIMEPVVNGLNIMLNLSGIYAPPPFNLNTMGNWNVESAYKLSMKNAAQLTISGNFADNVLEYATAGVKYLPVLSNQETSILEAIDNPEEDVIFITELRSGNIFWPEGGIETLDKLIPGVGYLARFQNPLTITFAPSTEMGTDGASHHSTPPAGPWAINRTTTAHIVSIQKEALQNINQNSFIGAFDALGNCVGFANTGDASSNIALIIYGDDEWSNEKDGAIEGEELSFALRNNKSGLDNPIIVEFDQSQASYDGKFMNNGTSIIKSIYKSSTGIANDNIANATHVFPNPAKNILNILTGEIAERITLLNTSGAVKKTLLPSDTETQMDISSMQKGVYFVKIEFADFIITKRIIVM